MDVDHASQDSIACSRKIAASQANLGKAGPQLRCFQATSTPMAKILRLHLSIQCALREITILHNFAIDKVEKKISLQRFRDLKTLFQNCFKIVSKLFQN
jgi:hypothetical protein